MTNARYTLYSVVSAVNITSLTAGEEIDAEAGDFLVYDKFALTLTQQRAGVARKIVQDFLATRLVTMVTARILSIDTTPAHLVTAKISEPTGATFTAAQVVSGSVSIASFDTSAIVLGDLAQVVGGIITRLQSIGAGQ